MKAKNLVLLLVLITAVFLAACSGETTDDDHADMDMNQNGMEMDTNDHEHDMENMDDHEHMEEEHMMVDRIPNEGAVIRLVSPADGATFAATDEVTVGIETEQATIGPDDYHWHIYIDDASWGMVMGQNMTQVLRGIEPGTHKLEVYLSNQAHEELQDGDGITIEVME